MFKKLVFAALLMLLITSPALANADKTIYVALFEAPNNPTTSTDATFRLGVANLPYHWPSDTTIETWLDNGVHTFQGAPNKPGEHVYFNYSGLSVGTHTWYAKITGTNISPLDENPGFSYVWEITP